MLTLSHLLRPLDQPTSGFPSLKPIDASLLPVLQRMLRSAGHLDPYARSAAYLAMTGRKGLWLYGDDGSGLILMRHPNCERTLLALPPFGRYRTGLVSALTNDPRFEHEAIQLGRITPDALAFHTAELARLKATLVEELVLDWRYPCHVLGTRLLLDRQGQAFKDFRKNLARAERARLTVRSIDPKADIPLLRALATSWADHHRAVHGGHVPQNAPEDPLIGGTAAVLDLMERGVLSIRGVLISTDKPQGFMIWEETDPVARHANGLCNVAMPGLKGASELSYAAMCEELAARGFETVCIGGSEEAGLDTFKRKLCPIQTDQLTTAILRSAPNLPH